MNKHYIWIFFVGIFSICTEAFAQSGCASSSRDAGAMFIDAGLVRPAGLVATVFGTAAYVVSLPFTLTSGNAGEAGKKLIVDPAAYTFSRPLGSNARCHKQK